jgi:SRSO17 transposase
VFLVSSFAILLQDLAVVMSGPSFHNLTLIVTGWVFAPRRTVTGMLMAAGVAGQRHHASFHRLFSSARWSLDALGLAVFRIIECWLTEGSILLAVDDTLAPKRGLKVFGANMHYDPQLSSRSKSITRWAHNWVILGVIVRFPLWPDRPFTLPILFRLYLNQKSATKHRRVYRTRPELAVEMLHLLCKSRKHRRFHAIADSAYGGQSVLARLPDNCDLTSRLLINARLHAAPPSPNGKPGRPRRRGQRLPSPQEMLQSRARQLTLDIYGRHQKARVCDMEARLYAVPERPVRIVTVEALRGGRGQEAFYSTCRGATSEQVLTWYSWRWSIEQTIRDGKQHLGFEHPQGWTRRAVERTAPLALLLYSLIVHWFVSEGHRRYQAPLRPWYKDKPHASFADMLRTLRQESAREKVLSLGLSDPGTRKIVQLLDHSLGIAA